MQTRNSAPVLCVLLIALSFIVLPGYAGAETYVFPSAGVKFTDEKGEALTVGPAGTVFTVESSNTRITLSAEFGVSSIEARMSALSSGTVFYHSAEELSGGELLLSASYLDEQGGSMLRLTRVIPNRDVLYTITADASEWIGWAGLRDALDSARGRVSFFEGLSGADEAVPLSLDTGARLVRSAGTLGLTAAGLPAWTDRQSIRMNASTASGAYVRVSVDGYAIAFAQADGNGGVSFEISMTGDDGIHTVELFAASGDRAAVRVYEILLARRRTPVVLRADEARVATGSFDLYVYSIPGASIVLTTPSNTMRARANDSGYVYFSLSMRRGAVSTYKVDASINGRTAGSAEVTFSRASGSGDTAEFRASVQNIPYKRLVDSPSYYAGRNLEFRGRIERVGESNGYPTLVVATDNYRSGTWRDPIYVVTHSLLKFEQGDIVTVIGVPRTQTYRYEGRDIPVLDGAFYFK